MRSTHRGKPGRGDLTLVVSALGLALIVAGGVVSLRADVEASRARASAAAAVSTGDGSTTPLPFVMEPTVRFATDPTPPRHPARGTPERLVVPGLGVNAPVVRIAAPGRVLVPPSDPRTLGWWKAGARPGASYGSALITGHTVSSGGGAFDDLETLRNGDRVRVLTSRGEIRYRVTGVTIYRKASLAKDAMRVFSQTVPGRLVLITCEDWNGSTYLSNAVVFAEPLH